MANNFQAPLTIDLNSDGTNKEQEVEEEASLLARSLATAVIFPMVLKAALELGVIDTMATVGDDCMWLSPSEIALKLPTKPSNPEAPVLLDRILRFLTSYSIFKCRTVETKEPGKIERNYAAQPVCKFLLSSSDVSGSFASLFMLNHGDVFIKTWTHLKDVILDGSDAFSSAHGMKFYEYIQTEERFGKVFNRAMLETSTMVMEKVLRVYEGFKDVKTLVDVGGGLGNTLGLITSKYPHLVGINFDVAPVLANAPSYPAVSHVAGDMFINVPNGDAIFMKWILHNWTDEECVNILKNCWKSLPKDGKVIIVETVTPTEAKSADIVCNIVFGMDMVMLAQLSGGKERSLSEYENLAYASGFSRCEIVCPVLPFSVIEIYK